MTQLIIGIGFIPGMLGSAEGHAFGTALSAFTSVPPSIDGDIQDSEWTNAAKIDIVMSNSESDIPGTLYIMNDANNLYIALEVEDEASIDTRLLQIRFDDNHDGLLDHDEDVFSHDPMSPTNFDSFLGSVEQFTNLVEYDIVDSGTSDGMVGVSDGVTNNYEFSHSLCSSDVQHDFCLASGNTVGFSILYFLQDVEPATWPLGVTEDSDASGFADIVIAESPSSAEISLRDFKPDRGLGSSYAPGDSITLLLEVENIGSQNIQENCMTINMGAFFPNQNVFFEHHDENPTTINSADIETFVYDFQIPANASSGWYDIMASVILGGELCGVSDEKEISHSDAFEVEETCNLPEGAVVVEDDLPDNYHSVTFSPSDIGVKSLPDPILPVTSIFVGTNNSEARGLVLSFSSDGLDYSCPILQPMISIELNDSSVITNVLVERIGGLSDSTGSITVNVNYVNHKFTQLPIGTSISLNAASPIQIHEVNFEIDGPRTIIVPLPDNGEVKGIWVEASNMVEDPYLYFRTFGEWFARPVELSSSALLSFETETSLSEVVVAVDDVLDHGNITIGYVYPIQLRANAGSDQVVVELQRVYLDGTRSEGSGMGLTYMWKQIAGQPVILSNANTAIANFVSPAGTVGSTGLDLRFQLTLKDTTGNMDTDTVAITLQPGGQSPVVFAGYDMTVDSGTQIILNGFVWDSDNKLSDVSIRWTQISGTPVVLQNSTTLAPSFIAPVLPVSEVQDLRFELVAEDINENTATAHVTIHVIGKQTESPTPSTPPSTPTPSTPPSTPTPSTPPSTPTPSTPPPLPASNVAANADFGIVNTLVSPITEVANNNPVLFIAIIIVIPSGIAVAVIAAFRHRASSRSDVLLNVKAARVLFPDSDPVADEYEATRPFIEALEKELGTKLDTATSISDLLEKFSGKKQVNSD